MNAILEQPEYAGTSRDGFAAHEKTTGKDEWLTPPFILRALGEFYLDPCAPKVRPWEMAKNHYHERGLQQEWFGRVWCNPPYSQVGKWMKKVAFHGNAIALTFARVETKFFYQSVWDKADAIFFFNQRLTFYTVDGRIARNKKGQPSNAGTGSCLIAYGQENVEAIAESGLEGKLIRLKCACAANQVVESLQSSLFAVNE